MKFMAIVDGDGICYMGPVQKGISEEDHLTFEQARARTLNHCCDMLEILTDRIKQLRAVTEKDFENGTVNSIVI